STRVPSVGYGLAAFTRPTGTWPAPTGGRVGGVFGTHRRQPISRWQDGLGSHICGQCGTQPASAIRPAFHRWVTAWRPSPTLPDRAEARQAGGGGAASGATYRNPCRGG